MFQKDWRQYDKVIKERKAEAFEEWWVLKKGIRKIFIKINEFPNKEPRQKKGKDLQTGEKVRFFCVQKRKDIKIKFICKP